MLVGTVKSAYSIIPSLKIMFPKSMNIITTESIISNVCKTRLFLLYNSDLLALTNHHILLHTKSTLLDKIVFGKTLFSILSENIKKIKIILLLIFLYSGKGSLLPDFTLMILKPLALRVFFTSLYLKRE